MSISEQDYEARALPELRALVDALDELELSGVDCELSSDILQGTGAPALQYAPRSDPGYVKSLDTYSFDPDKAKFYLNKAGQTGLKVELNVNDVAFTGATDRRYAYMASESARVTLV